MIEQVYMHVFLLTNQAFINFSILINRHLVGSNITITNVTTFYIRKIILSDKNPELISQRIYYKSRTKTRGSNNLKIPHFSTPAVRKQQGIVVRNVPVFIKITTGKNRYQMIINGFYSVARTIKNFFCYEITIIVAGQKRRKKKLAQLRAPLLLGELLTNFKKRLI